MTIPNAHIAIHGAGKTTFQNLMRRNAEPSLRCVMTIIDDARIPGGDVGRLTHRIRRDKVCSKSAPAFEPLPKADFIGGDLIAAPLDPYCRS